VGPRIAHPGHRASGSRSPAAADRQQPPGGRTNARPARQAAPLPLGTLLRRSVSYYCALGHAARSDHPHVYISERKLLPWVKEEAGRLRTPDRLTVEVEADAERERHEAQRLRLVDQYELGHIDQDRYLQHFDAITVALGRLDAQVSVVDVPDLDWDAPTEDINEILRSIFQYVQLDRNLKPLRAEWTVPQWRAD
jgi:hypothetical protein